jgi:UDP-2-acetamido-2,6-beta-L-arabino-hexul-4-ose reductase
VRVIVTGGGGFLGSNLIVRLRELGGHDVINIECGSSAEDLGAASESADFVFHLAGVNRPQHLDEFDLGNREFTETLCDALRGTGRSVPLAYTSSTQAVLDNPYGASKRAGEIAVARYAAETGAPTFTFRLPNVFGKWCRPNYNSAVATFCHNIANGLPIVVNDPSAPLRLVYVDDVVEAMVSLLGTPTGAVGAAEVKPVYETTVGEMAEMLHEFAGLRESRLAPRAGHGFARALYATYLSYLAPDNFSYALPRHSDARGTFVEMVKTRDSGQCSFFTAHPGITRGGHYHHTKNEKFLVVTGRARFGFRHITTGEVRELVVSGEESRVVVTVPGWAHDITNIGDGEMIVMLWANEMFDPERPDTIAAPVLG